MDALFEIDTSDLAKLAIFCRKKAPSAFARATGHMLNEFAVGTRHAAIETIREKMVVRDPRFVAWALRVSKSHKRMPMESQRSIVGSIAGPRFSGWREQQTGQKTTRKRIMSLLARSGKLRRKVAARARMKPSVKFPTYREYSGKSPHHRTIVMMQKLGRARATTPFIVTRHERLDPGLYKFHRKKVRMLQAFDVVQPKRVPWITIARDRYFKRENLPKLWGRTLKYNLPKSL